MSQAISVLFVASEAAPYVRTGELGEVANTLPLALRECGHDVRLMFPKYGFMSERRNRIHEITRLKEYAVPIAGAKDLASCKSSSLNNARAKVQVYVVGNQTYFGRNGVYADPHTHKPYPDNGERFAFFCRSVLETCKLLGWRPTIIHCNDWQTGLIPAFAKLLYAEDGFFSNTKFVFTAYNLANQGVFDKSAFEATGLPKTAWSDDGVMHANKLNFTKAGVMFSDVVTTVSPAYADSVMTKDGGHGLQTLFETKKRKRIFSGVLNGIDFDLWDPHKDKHIVKKYNATTSGDKIENKRALFDQLGFEFQPDIPLIGYEGPFNDEKGTDILIEALPKLLKENVRIVVHGAGDIKYQDALAKLAKKNEDKFAAEIGHYSPFSHMLYAASDMVIAPSRIETSGAPHFCAMRYGAVPIVHSVGGLRDAVCETPSGKGQIPTGFVFPKANATEFFKAVKRALDVWEDHARWKRLQEHVMSVNHSWNATAEAYSAVYRAAIKKD